MHGEKPVSYRTDLAIENRELLEEEGKQQAEVSDDGVDFEQYDYDEGIKVTNIKILDERGEALLGRRRGTYITIEVKELPTDEDELKDKAAEAVRDELLRLMPKQGKGSGEKQMKALVVGLGNEKITPDSLGPHTVSKIMVTRHIFAVMGEENCENMSCVSGLAPGVTGTTGIETFDLIKKTAEIVEPDVIVIIDSLAARSTDRISSTIQISDGGIAPGAGMGNNRKELSAETLGRCVIAIGVPTVIDAGTLIIDALRDFAEGDEKISEYLRQNAPELIVTPTGIDELIKCFSEIIAKGINMALHGIPQLSCAYNER